MIIFDTLISLVDTVSHYLQLDYVFEPERCAPEPYYLPVYCLLVTVREKKLHVLIAFNYNYFLARIRSGVSGGYAHPYAIS